MFIPLAEPLPSVLAAAAVWGLSGCGDPGQRGERRHGGKCRRVWKGAKGAGESGAATARASDSLSSCSALLSSEASPTHYRVLVFRF